MRKITLRALSFIFPVSLWAFLFRLVLCGKALIPSQETLHIYAVIKFYFDHLRVGTFPLWSPYICWGMPIVVYLSYVCIFNPIWIMMLFLNLIGLSTYQAFLITISAYFLLGVFGFYMLAKRLFRDEATAYAIGLIFFFSSVSLSTFVQYHPVLIFVPAVWFFYFLMSFVQTWSKKHFLGLVYACMMIMTSYLPLYFLTVFLLFLLFFVPLYFSVAKNFMICLFRFMGKNRILVLLCFFALAAAAWSSVQAYQQTTKKEVVVPFRRDADIVFEPGASFNKNINCSPGSLASRTSFEELFVRLGDLEYLNEGIVYISVPVFIVFIFSLGGFWTRKTIVIVGMGTVLFLIMLNDITPIHEFLFDHISYFRLVRNYFFYNPFLIGLFLLFIGEQLKTFLTKNISGKTLVGKYLKLTFVLLVHGGMVVFLYSFQENIIISTYIALLLSAVYWGRRSAVSGTWKIGYIIFILSLLIQPVEVFWRYNNKAVYQWEDVGVVTEVQNHVPTFSFSRPQKDVEVIKDENEQIFTLFYWVSLKDSPGYFMEGQSGFPAYWSYYLVHHFPELKTAPLLRNKFILYDRVEFVTTDDITVSREIVDMVLNKENRVFISKPKKAILDAEKVLSGLVSSRQIENVAIEPMVIQGNTEEFQVKKGLANKVVLQTNFLTEKFLVYTDSYSDSWQASLNGRKTDVFQSNLAFKGVYLPPGKNEIVFRYFPGGTEILYFVIALVFLFVGGAVMVVYIWDFLKNKKR